jgi:hypothetical protein
MAVSCHLIPRKSHDPFDKVPLDERIRVSLNEDDISNLELI